MSNFLLNGDFVIFNICLIIWKKEQLLNKCRFNILLYFSIFELKLKLKLYGDVRQSRFRNEVFAIGMIK